MYAQSHISLPIFYHLRVAYSTPFNARLSSLCLPPFPPWFAVRPSQPSAVPRRNPRPFPPRGGATAGDAPNSAWQDPGKLGPEWDYPAPDHDGRPDRRSVLLGEWGGRQLSVADDRHMVTIAGSRAGKSQTVLIPNLRAYPGPAVVIDPKGELFAATRAERSRLGEVIWLDPFNVTGQGSHAYNPLAELALTSPDLLGAESAQIADALIIPPERGDSHWTDAAKNLITGIILHLVTTDPATATIPLLRTHLTKEAELPYLLDAMASNDQLDGMVSNVGRSMMGKFTREAGRETSMTQEMRSIVSTASEQTRPLDDVHRALARSDFQLSWLSDPSRRPMTVYLIIPATRIATHHRWLRLFIYQVLAALERQSIPRERLPLWLVLEEFAALGPMRNIEAAAGYMAGFGIKLWAILQDLTQLKRHYPDSWETFLGNAGVIQAFANVDVTTTRYLSSLLGDATVIERQQNFTDHNQFSKGDDGTREQRRSVPLLAPAEITFHFARKTNRQLVLVPGESPVYMMRLPLPSD